MATEMLKLINRLQNPVPQYVLGCLPAIATIGASPKEDFVEKLIWVAICLACPFMGLFYTCNVKSDETVIYWLPKRYFSGKYGEEIPYKPVGHRVMQIEPKDQLNYLKDCVANASVLERLSSLASAYYILVGIIAGIVRALGSQEPNACKDWPYIPLALSWTLPAIYRRIVQGKLVVRDPKRKLDLENIRIRVKELDNEDKRCVHARVVITVLASIAVPWITVFLAYLIPPIGFSCRSKYLSVLSFIWSFNSIIAYIHHWVEGKNVTVDNIIYIWFAVCGFAVAILLFLLGLLSSERSWWVKVFGKSCDISITCPS